MTVGMGDYARLVKTMASWKNLHPEWERVLSLFFVSSVVPRLMEHRFGYTDVEVRPVLPGDIIQVVCPSQKAMVFVTLGQDRRNPPSGSVPVIRRECHDGWKTHDLIINFQLENPHRIYSVPGIVEPDFPETVHWLDCLYAESREFRRVLLRWFLASY